jgi:hypothetical protein
VIVTRTGATARRVARGEGAERVIDRRDYGEMHVVEMDDRRRDPSSLTGRWAEAGVDLITHSCIPPSSYVDISSDCA